jgi:hypothetical protein
MAKPRTGTDRKPSTLRGNVRKRSAEQSGGWRRNGWKSRYMKSGDLFGETDPGRSQRFHSSVEAG